MKVKMNLKMKITEFLINFDFEIDNELETVTLDTWEEMFQATKSSVSLKKKVADLEVEK